MISLGISPRDRRILTVGAISVGSILAIGKGWPAVRRWEVAQVAAAAEVGEQLAAAERNAVLVPSVRDSASARTKRFEAERSRMIKSTSAEAAAAALGAIVESLAAKGNVDVLTMTLRPDTNARLGLARVGVRFGAEGDVDGLIDLLMSLETHERPIAVRELSVVQPDPTAPASRAEALRFDVTVETLAQVGAARGRNR